MSAFFDATATADLALVTTTFRANADLVTLAAVTELDVIEQFTRPEPPRSSFNSEFFLSQGYALGQGDYVALRGFNPDADLVTDSGLKLALKYTIVDVLVWRLAKTDENPALQTVTTAQGQVRVKSQGFHEPFPPGDWSYRLRRWDLRQVNVVIG